MLGCRGWSLFTLPIALYCVGRFYDGEAGLGWQDATLSAPHSHPAATGGTGRKPRTSFNAPTSRLCGYPCSVLRKWAKKSRARLGDAAADSPLAFVHIPKTGGTSVERAFGIAVSCHVTASAMSSCDGPRGNQPYKSALSFAVLRHPVDRVVSMYDFVRRNPEDGGPSGTEKHGWVRGVDFDGFVEALPGKWEYFYAPMAHFVKDDAGNLIVKEVLCFDDLEAGLGHIMTLIPWSGPVREKNWSSKRWRSSGNHTVTAISAVTLKRLHEYYRDDFELWSQLCGDRGSILFPEYSTGLNKPITEHISDWKNQGG